MAKTCHIAKPELMFCTEPEPVVSKPPPTELHPQHSLENSDPYDELLSMILQDCTGQGETVKAERRQSISNPPTANPPGSSLARASAGGSHSDERARADPLPSTRTDPPQTQNKRVVQFQGPPGVKRRSYTELFIEEEEESVREKEEEVLGCWERAPPQVEHGVCCICWVQGVKC